MDLEGPRAALPQGRQAPAGRETSSRPRRRPDPWQFAPTFTKVIDTANNELTAVIEGKQTVTGMLKKIESTANDALR